MTDLTTKVITNNRPILLGKSGENEATLIKFPINVFFPFVSATSFSLVHQRHGDVAPYPCVISQSDGFINWSINSADVANPGSGMAILTAYNDAGLVAKTVTFTTVTTDSLGYTTPPEPQAAWVDQVEGYAKEAKEAAMQSSESVAAIQNLGVSAETGDPVAVRKVVDPDTGAVTLVFTIPSGAAVEVDSAISRISRNPVENRAIANALPLSVGFEDVTLSEFPAGEVTETVDIRTRDVYNHSVLSAVQNNRPVLGFVNFVDTFEEGSGWPEHTYRLEMLARAYKDRQGEEFVEFYGEIPPAPDEIFLGGKLTLRSVSTGSPIDKTFSVTYEPNS